MRRLAALGLVAGLVASACSGSKPQSDAGSSKVEASDGAIVNDPGAGEASATAAAGGGAGAPAGANGAKTGATRPSVATSQGSTAAGGTPKPYEATLYSGKDNTIGISDSEIVMCAHAALIFAEAFQTKPEDLNVYWDEINSKGGIFGRKVKVTYEDDAYRPDNAVQAAERCKAKNPFILLGGIGFDQIPAVRTWAEQNKMLYFHHIAVEAGLGDKKFSFSAFPSVDRAGRAFGELIVSRYRARKIGIIWRQSENWEPGHRTGKALLDSKKVNVVADLPVQKDQSVFAAQIQELQSKGAEVVWIWENALVAAEIIQQAQNQNYKPQWLLFPFQTTLDVIGNAALSPPIVGVAAWPAYTRGGYGNAFAQFDYGSEIAKFEATMARLRPGVAPNDILWQVWIGNKAMHDLFTRCGAGCNRNRMAGIFLSGLKTTINPNCLVDFSRPDSFGGRLGGHEWFVQEAYRKGDSAQFKTTSWCAEHLS